MALRDFDRSEIGNLSLGNLEGEKDLDQLNKSFFLTHSVIKCLNGKYNYILSPKGGGKSALFTAIKNKYIPNEYLDYEKYSILPINDGFIYESENRLDSSKFKEVENKKEYVIAWGMYLLIQCIEDIRNNHSNKSNYNSFISKISEYSFIKKDLKLYNIGDFIRQMNLKLNFTIEGQPIEISPSVYVPQLERNLNLNRLFDLVNTFYRDNKLTVLVLIDRLDNFVARESYLVQKNYIQGLFDCIEELSNYDSIAPVLFLRTDLFYSFDLSLEYDKVQDRLMHLDWEEGEILTFIVIRFINNEYIFKNYISYLSEVVNSGIGERHKSYKNVKYPFLKRIQAIFKRRKLPSKELDLKRTFSYNTAEKYLYTFFPKDIDFVDGEFCNFIFKYFIDSNEFVNPRLLIRFFNKLFEKQAFVDRQIKLNSDDMAKSSIVAKDNSHFELFDQEVIKESYLEVQNEMLKFIYMLLEDKSSKNLFIHLNEISSASKKFDYSYHLVRSSDMPRDKYDRIIKYLMLLGYMRELKKGVKYEVPILYNARMNLKKEYT